ncbi:hypothetical protein MOX02_54080 [Methylobacterium oxalidis]|nr:hypothetical protein MOX02_54080 [Methylobacterium oxalidis]
MAWLNTSQRDAMFAEMIRSGVKAVRLNIQPPLQDSKNSLVQAHKHGLSVLLVVTLSAKEFYEPGTERRPGNAMVKAAYPLSKLDVGKFEESFGAFWRDLDQSGVVLSGVEVGNEIDWAEFNGDLGVYSKEHGRVGFRDLANYDAIERGIEKYLGIVSAVRRLKESILSARNTVIVAAGMANIPSHWAAKSGADALEVEALQEKLFKRGLARSVDALAIHHYPNADSAPDLRKRALRATVAKCGAAKIGVGCWLTEWGVRNDERNCPVDDKQRAKIVREVREIVDPVARAGEIAALFYFEWSSNSQTSIWRCGDLTEAGRIAIAPVAAK